METFRDHPRILLSEGSSLSARQTVTVLGLSGYSVGVCDPNPWCISRFSRFVKWFYRCPAFNDRPLDYARYVASVAQQGGYQAVIPVHEQAYVLAKYRHLISTPISLANFPAFQKVQGKVAFARALQDLSLPQPDFQIVDDLNQVRKYSDYPFYLKTNFGNAGQGVWRIDDEAKRDRVIMNMDSKFIARENKLLIQRQINGQLCQVQAVFDQGELWASHSTQTRGTSLGGGHAARTSVEHPVVCEHVRALGNYLNWHGPIALDYIYDESAAQPYYLEANPRLVEPMNAYLSGINFPELIIQAALGRDRQANQTLPGKVGVRSHSLIAILLGLAGEGRSRAYLIQNIRQSIEKKGIFEDSKEDLTPFALDPLSAIPFVVVLGQLLISPRRAIAIGEQTIDSYSLRASTIASLGKLS